MHCIAFIFVLILNTVFAKDSLKVKEHPDFDRYLIACHSTDYVCFKRQYNSLRDNVLLGQRHLGIDIYEPYLFQYGDTGTCIEVSGMEKSELSGIRFDSFVREFTLKLDFPLKIQQVKNNGRCRQPKHKIGPVEPNKGQLRQFTGNGSIEVIFPYELKKKNNYVYLDLQDQTIDMLLDIPDTRNMDVKSEDYINTEWAYRMVQHFDGAEYIALPYTEKYRIFAARVPLKRYLLLYPEEDYNDLQFSLDFEYFMMNICENLF